jgi:acyl-CoA synthetase (AMP-forming)/AMP-acid ligase II
MTAPATILRLLAAGVSGERPAIGSPGREPLYGKGLIAQIEMTVAALNGFGIGRNQRVAIVLPNGPAMATAFLGVAACATAAPLNPDYKAAEFAFYLDDLGASALIVEEGSTSPAIEVASGRGIPIFTLRVGNCAGEFILIGMPVEVRADALGEADVTDTALVLHTSGTTSRPKMVPLSQRNVTASAQAVAGTLALTESDRALNIMPLFHIHGLVAGLLAPISAGGFVSCTNGFNALRFFAWMDEVQPSWYTAVPTMHQAILLRAPHNRSIIERHPLRFVRSSSSSMPTQVIKELESTFHAPLIESYGMTEAAHQMASNPLPPAVRKVGTVGRAAGPDLAIMNEAGVLLVAGTTGEIVIRGSSVTTGYEANPEANATAFTDGWFRTGDIGVIDEEGYLTINGRIKEIINRGGEKISPRELDEILMSHPAVAQAVTFAIPHDRLGEDIGSAIVLRENASVTPREIRDFVGAQVAEYKRPNKVIILDEIPKGPTGKIQRIGLAQKLGLA